MPFKKSIRRSVESSQFLNDHLEKKYSKEIWWIFLIFEWPYRKSTRIWYIYDVSRTEDGILASVISARSLELRELKNHPKLTNLGLVIYLYDSINIR